MVFVSNNHTANGNGSKKSAEVCPDSNRDFHKLSATESYQAFKKTRGTADLKSVERTKALAEIFRKDPSIHSRFIENVFDQEAEEKIRTLLPSATSNMGGDEIWRALILAEPEGNFSGGLGAKSVLDFLGAMKKIKNQVLQADSLVWSHSPEILYQHLSKAAFKERSYLSISQDFTASQRRLIRLGIFNLIADKESLKPFHDKARKDPDKFISDCIGVYGKIVSRGEEGRAASPPQVRVRNYETSPLGLVFYLEQSELERLGLSSAAKKVKGLVLINHEEPLLDRRVCIVAVNKKEAQDRFRTHELTHIFYESFLKDAEHFPSYYTDGISDLISLQDDPEKFHQAFNKMVEELYDFGMDKIKDETAAYLTERKNIPFPLAAYGGFNILRSFLALEQYEVPEELPDKMHLKIKANVHEKISSYLMNLGEYTALARFLSYKSRKDNSPISPEEGSLMIQSVPGKQIEVISRRLFGKKKKWKEDLLQRLSTNVLSTLRGRVDKWKSSSEDHRKGKVLGLLDSLEQVQNLTPSSGIPVLKDIIDNIDNPQILASAVTSLELIVLSRFNSIDSGTIVKFRDKLRTLRDRKVATDKKTSTSIENAINSLNSVLELTKDKRT